MVKRCRQNRGKVVPAGQAQGQRGTIFARFTPAVSPKASKAMRQTIRSWRLHLKTTLSLGEVAQQIRPTLRGWVQYYGHFNWSLLIRALRTVDEYLVRWAMGKFKGLRDRGRMARKWLMKLKAGNLICYLHGCPVRTGRQEPYEPRGSRTVL